MVTAQKSLLSYGQDRFRRHKDPKIRSEQPTSIMQGRRQAFAASVSLAACIARVVTGSSVSSPGAWRILFVGESSGVQVGARLCRQQQQLLRNRAAALPASPAGTAGAIRRYSYCSQSVIVRSIALRNLLSAQESDVSKRATSESGWGCQAGRKLYMHYPPPLLLRYCSTPSTLMNQPELSTRDAACAQMARCCQC